jgi:hypothetical protein
MSLNWVFPRHRYVNGSSFLDPVLVLSATARFLAANIYYLRPIAANANYRLLE